MQKIRVLIGIMISILLGIIYCPLMMIAITDIAGTAKGSAYTISDPELSLYRLIGIVLLSILIAIFILIEAVIKKKLLDNKNRLSYLSIGIVIFEIIFLRPIFA